MPEKRFKDIEGDDSRLREQYLKDHDQQPPDNFVESAEGGGIDSREREKQSPTEEWDAIQKIDEEIRELRPEAFDDGESLKY